MSFAEITTLVIVRYAQYEEGGVLTREGIARLERLTNCLGEHIFDISQVFYLEFEGKPPDSPLSRTARVISGFLRQDVERVQGITVTGDSNEERASNVRTLVEVLHDGSATVFVVVNSELSSSLAALYTTGWPQDCVSILDPGSAHVLRLDRKLYKDL